MSKWNLKNRKLFSQLFLAAAWIVASAMISNAMAADSATTDQSLAKKIRSGNAIGEPVPSFYVRAVTGPLRNKSVCYVCRNGNRPVVMVLVQKIDPELKTLLKGIDGIVDQNRAVGLRSFGVLISEEPSQDAPSLQTLAFNEKISIPLTVSTTVVASASCQNVHPDAAVTVVLYRKQKVISTYAFREGELKTASIDNVLNSVRKFAAEEE